MSWLIGKWHKLAGVEKFLIVSHVAIPIAAGIIGSIFGHNGLLSGIVAAVLALLVVNTLIRAGIALQSP